jgi:hypothetical protein
MGPGGEPRLVVGLQQQAHHLADEFVRPGGQAQRTPLPVLLGNPRPLDRAEAVALMAQRIDDATDLAQRHAVHGLRAGPGRHRTLIGVDTPVGQQVQLRVEQLSIQLIQRQATPAAFTQDTQHRFGVLHFAYLPISVMSDHLRRRHRCPSRRSCPCGVTYLCGIVTGRGIGDTSSPALRTAASAIRRVRNRFRLRTSAG